MVFGKENTLLVLLGVLNWAAVLPEIPIIGLKSIRLSKCIYFSSGMLFASDVLLAQHINVQTFRIALVCVLSSWVMTHNSFKNLISLSVRNLWSGRYPRCRRDESLWISSSLNLSTTTFHVSFAPLWLLTCFSWDHISVVNMIYFRSNQDMSQ